MSEQRVSPEEDFVIMDNEPRRDIMSEILDGKADAPSYSTDDLEKIIYRDPKELHKAVHKAFRLTSISDRKKTDDLRKLVEPDPADEFLEDKSFHLTPLNKKKTTIYFTKKIHKMLKSAKYRMKKMVDPELQKRVSMSLIINNALIIVLHEFDVKGEDSILLKQMMKKLKKN